MAGHLDYLTIKHKIPSKVSSTMLRIVNRHSGETFTGCTVNASIIAHEQKPMVLAVHADRAHFPTLGE